MANIFVDDVRDVSYCNFRADEWIVCRDAKSAFWEIIRHVTAGIDVVASLDHDLGEDTPTGYDLVNMLEKFIAVAKPDNNWLGHLYMTVHSANPVGADRMRAGIDSINKLQKVGT